MTVPEAKKNAELALELIDALMMAPSATKDATVFELRERIVMIAESKAAEEKKEEDEGKEKEKEGLSIIRFDSRHRALRCTQGTLDGSRHRPRNRPVLPS